MNTPRNKLCKLKNFISKFKNAVVAYSGGVDSTLVFKVSAEVLGKENVIGVTAISEIYPSVDKKSVERFLKKNPVQHIYIRTSELKNKIFRSNPPNRCYYCKKELFNKLNLIAKKFQFNTIFDGTNCDDLNDFRPGRLAAKEFNVVSPLLETKLTKADVREISKYLKLNTYNKPATSCLASRIPYRMKIDKKTLKKIQIAENFIRKVGFQDVRVRHYGDIARIEVSQEQIKLFANKTLRNKIIKKLKTLGYKYITVDLEGYRTGSLNLF